MADKEYLSVSHLHVEKRITGDGYVNNPTLEAALYRIHGGFTDLQKGLFRPAIASAPTILSGAASTMIANSRPHPFGYQSSQSLVSVAGGNVAREDNAATIIFDSVTTTFDLQTRSGSTYHVAFIHTGTVFELEFSPSTTSVFFLAIDGEFESATAITETNAFRKYTFAAAAKRRIDIWAASGTAVNQFQLRKVRIEPTDGISKAPIRGPRTIFMGDSFASSPGSYPLAFAHALGWDDVWGGGLGGTGYINTQSDAKPNYLMRLQQDVIDYNPDVVMVCGSGNDNQYTYNEIYTQALKIYEKLVEKIPNSLICAVNHINRGVDSSLASEWKRVAALKAAASRAGVLFIDPIQQPESGLPWTTTAQFAASASATNITISQTWATSSGARGFESSTLVVGDAESETQYRYHILSIQQSGAYTRLNLAGTLHADIPAGTPLSIVGSSYMVGTGYQTATTGIGNADLLVSSDGTHPSYPDGQDALGIAIANTFINKLLER